MVHAVLIADSLCLHFSAHLASGNTARAHHYQQSNRLFQQRRQSPAHPTLAHQKSWIMDIGDASVTLVAMPFEGNPVTVQTGDFGCIVVTGSSASFTGGEQALGATPSLRLSCIKMVRLRLEMRSSLRTSFYRELLLELKWQQRK